MAPRMVTRPRKARREEADFGRAPNVSSPVASGVDTRAQYETLVAGMKSIRNCIMDGSAVTARMP